MRFMRYTLLVAIGLLFSVQVAFGRGGVDGGGGGGEMVPSGTTKLTETYRDGITFLADGECKRAEKKFRAVLKKVPRNSEANYLLGISLQCRKDHKSAIRYFKRSKRDDAQFYQAYGALGITYLTLERPDLAEKELQKLSAFKDLCQTGNKRCPPELLKSHRKLLEATKRTQGQTVQRRDEDK
jgi:tetratricopeptide (TPR) repeat protein